jgi:hypothetical protein
MAEQLTASLRDQVLQRVIRLGIIGRLVTDVALVAGGQATEAGEFRHDAEGHTWGRRAALNGRSKTMATLHSSPSCLTSTWS